MNIETEIQSIQQRNKRVQTDKAWEISWTRRLFIGLVTYIFAGLWLVTLKESAAWLKALVPAVGYVFSTLTLGPVKQWWIKKSGLT